MRTATALSLLAVGAIFAFAVNAHTSFLNFQVLGWVLILTAIAGLIIPRRGRGWRRRTVLVKEPPDTTAEGANEAGQGGAAESAPAESSGKVESESIVEFTEQ